jgi:hypothetical protein
MVMFARGGKSPEIQRLDVIAQGGLIVFYSNKVIALFFFIKYDWMPLVKPPV